MRKMNELLERVSVTFIKVVIVFVFVDMLLLLVELLPQGTHELIRVFKAILIGSCAVIPASGHSAARLASPRDRRLRKGRSIISQRAA